MKALLFVVVLLAGCASGPPTLRECLDDDELCPPASNQQVREFLKAYE